MGTQQRGALHSAAPGCQPYGAHPAARLLGFTKNAAACQRLCPWWVATPPCPQQRPPTAPHLAQRLVGALHCSARVPRGAPNVGCLLDLGRLAARAASAARRRCCRLLVRPPASAALLLRRGGGTAGRRRRRRRGGRQRGACAPVALVSLVCRHALQQLLLLLPPWVVGRQQDVAVGVLQLLRHPRVLLRQRGVGGGRMKGQRLRHACVAA